MNSECERVLYASLFNRTLNCHPCIASSVDIPVYNLSVNQLTMEPDQN